MFSLEGVIHFHDLAIERYGGSKGIRDFGGLDAALNRLWQTFGGEELYPSAYSKASAILESVILNNLSLMKINGLLFFFVKLYLKHTDLLLMQVQKAYTISWLMFPQESKILK